MDAAIMAKVSSWLSGNYDEETKGVITRLLKDDPEELTEGFYKNLEFGTGGLRGIMGVGTNRINKYTIGMATQGYSNYLLKSFPNQMVKVAVAHDSRNNSRFFAETAAKVFAANGIKVFLFQSLRPTPELVQNYVDKVRLGAKRRAHYLALKDKPSITRDGVTITLLHNSGLVADLPMLRDTGAEGVGLFRT